MLSYQYFCDKCSKSWQFDTAPGMAAFGTSHWRTCESNRPTRQSVSTDCVGQSADLRTRIAAAIYNELREQSDRDTAFPVMVGPAVGSPNFNGVALIDGEVDLDAAADAIIRELKLTEDAGVIVGCSHD